MEKFNIKVNWLKLIPRGKKSSWLVPKDILSFMVGIMKKADIRPEMIYAFEKTGRILTAATYDNLTDAEQEEWEDAIDDYYIKNGMDPEVERDRE